MRDARSCVLEQEPRAVDRGHGKSALRERRRMPPRTTTEIEHLAPADAGEPEDLLYLFFGNRKGVAVKSGPLPNPNDPPPPAKTNVWVGCADPVGPPLAVVGARCVQFTSKNGQSVPQ